MKLSDLAFEQITTSLRQTYIFLPQVSLAIDIKYGTQKLAFN